MQIHTHTGNYVNDTYSRTRRDRPGLDIYSTKRGGQTRRRAHTQAYTSWSAYIFTTQTTFLLEHAKYVQMISVSQAIGAHTPPTRDGQQARSYKTHTHSQHAQHVGIWNACARI